MTDHQYRQLRRARQDVDPAYTPAVYVEPRKPSPLRLIALGAILAILSFGLGYVVAARQANDAFEEFTTNNANRN